MAVSHVGLRRGLKYGLGFGIFGGCATYLGYEYYSNNGNWDGNNIGIIRFGRAAVAVGTIGYDYKKTLFSSTGRAMSEAASSEDSSSNQENSAVKAYEELKSAVHLRSAEKLLKLCCDNGGCFIKVGQHIGALDYLLPDEYVKTLKVLHSKAPEMPLHDVFSVIREDLDKSPEEIFSSFDEKPLGTASLAQVHKAVLRDTGQEVAVKVQHRYVKNHSFVDIYTMDFLVKTVKLFFPQFEFMWLADEMRKNLPLELSFVNEGLNAERVENTLKFDWLKIPTIYWEHTTDRILVMEYFNGGHIDDVAYMDKHGINRFDVSKKISKMYADMIFKYGYVHCDPHPGNVLVKKSGNGSQADIVLLDHGLYTQLTNQFRLDYSNFWLSILKADLDGIKTSADKLGVGKLYGIFACMVTGRSWGSIQKGIDRAEKNAAENKEIKENAGRYIREIADVLAYVNRQMILIFKTNDLLRTIEYNLGTKHNMSSFVQMSRACYRVLSENRLKQCHSYRSRLSVSLIGSWDQLKISFYQIFLWLWFSRIGIYARRSIQ